MSNSYEEEMKSEDNMSDNDLTLQDIEKRYPDRELSPEAYVTRVAPSPTGFAHLGFIYVSLISKQIAQDSNGVFIFRLEDTDQKREIQGSDQKLLDALSAMELGYDEGIVDDQQEKGNYGPYRQTERLPIYHAFVEKLLKENKAYYCFMTEKEINQTREAQEKKGVRSGIYGDFSCWRNASPEKVQEYLDKNIPHVIRFKWPNEERDISVHDLSGVKYNFKSSAVAEDFVLLKSDGIPTYHLAHLVDDYLMKVNLVIRGNEWVSSLPKHLMLHESLGMKSPQYYHVPPIEIIDSESKGRRKLSKRKDPEADVFNLLKEGYSVEALKAYLFRLATSQYEDKALQMHSPTVPNFKLDPTMLKSGAGALFDRKKLENISTEIITRKSPQELAKEAKVWSKIYFPALFEVISSRDIEYFENCLQTVNNPIKNRKDLQKYSQIYDKIGFFYEQIYDKTEYDTTAINTVPARIIRQILDDFNQSFKTEDTPEIFLEKMKTIAYNNNFAANKDELMRGSYLGLWSTIPAIIRVAIAKKNVSPDLYDCLKVLGKDVLKQRSENLLKYIENGQ